MDRLITFCAGRCFALAICPGLKECFHMMRTQHHALGIFDVVDEPETVMSVAWELRRQSVHTPLVALTDDIGEGDEDILYRSGFNAVLAKSAGPGLMRDVLMNYLQVGMGT